MNFLKKIFSPSCLIISLFLLIYTFYKSEIHFDGKKSDFYITYYILSIILIIFSIFTFLFNQKIKEYSIISIISIVVSLYLFEAYLNFYGKIINVKKKIYKNETGIKFDTRTRYEIYKDLKKIDNNIKLNVSPSNYIDTDNTFYPLSAISNSKTIFCNENGYYSIYQSDRYGFNNPDTEWDQEEVEYLLVGDSYVHGACVNRPNDIASVLRTLSDKSVLNLGFSGNGPLIQYATLREYLNSNVKKVLWIYFEGNDLTRDLDKELENKILKNYLSDLNFTQNLKLRQKEINVYANELIEIERKWESFSYNFLRFIKIYSVRYLLTPKTKPQLKKGLQPEFKEIIRLVKDLTYENRIKLYFIYLPEYGRYKPNYNNQTYILVKKFVNQLNIPFIDLHINVFKKEKNPLKLSPFQLPGHYTVEGYKKIADTIYKSTQN